MIWLAWVSVGLGATDTRPLVVEALTTRDGLPQGTVLATLQDSQGFVWIGTEDGLVRFDGHEFHRYTYSAGQAAGLPGNFINAIEEDRQGDLWIGIKGSGVAHWHRATDTFTTYRHDPANITSLASDAVRALLLDRAGALWVGTMDAGIDVLKPGEDRFQHVRHDSKRPESLANDQVYALTEDRSGAIWVGTYEGLDRSRDGAAGFTHISLDTGPSPPAGPSQHGGQVSSILQDADNTFWIGTFDAGLAHVGENGTYIGRYQHMKAEVDSLANDEVRALLDDHAGHLWVGTANGLDMLDRRTGRFQHYSHTRSDPESLSDSFVMSLYQDKTGLVWIGTRSGGVDRWSPRSWELGGSRPEWLDGKLVTAFADAPGHRVWVASLGGGLVRFDPASGESIDVDELLHRPNALGDRRVMALHEDRTGALWIGTMTQGLKKLEGTRLTSIPVRPGDGRALSAGGIVTIYEAADGRLWIGTHGGGVNVLDPGTGAVRQLPYASDLAGAVSAENVTAFLEDRKGNFWIGTDSGGLDLARPDGVVVKVFKHEPRVADSLSANTVYSLALDRDGGVWIATEGGLDFAVGTSDSPENIRFRTLSTRDGLTSDTIYSVLPDSFGHLWLSSNSGVMRYDLATGNIKTFHREHGLQGEEFDSGASLYTRDGRLCFGGPGGFNIFSPQELTEARAPPRLALTRLEVLGAPVKTPLPYWLLKRIDLDYRANIVSLDFAPLDFTSLNRNKIAYRMPGLTDEWISLGSLSRVTLTNLEAGDHVLEVRAANADSVWSAEPLRLIIHKTAAPWRSNLAYALYTIALCTVVAGLVRSQRRKLRRALAAQQRLESEVALRTSELRETNRQLLVASEAKSSFLARMGHELRTPMNGVVGMTELLARSPLSSSQARQTQTIRSSAETLLRILNDLLDLSKAQAGKIQLEHLQIDLVRVIEESAALFSGAAEAKGLELTVCPPVGAGWRLLGDGLRIRQILMNLIGNAIKFTERGEVVITCDIDTAPDAAATARISVADTGIGMTEAAQKFVFEPFAQADETTTRRYGGTGLGLSICREFVQLMGGTIDVRSVPMAGSMFTVTIPLGLDVPAREPPDPLLEKCSVRVLTRRPSIANSMQRYLSVFMPEHLEVEYELSVATGAHTGLVVLDLDCASPNVCAAAFRADVAARLIVFGSAMALAQHRFDGVCSDQVLQKPVTREALTEALKSALNASPRPFTAPAPVGVGRGQAHVLIVEDEQINAVVAEGYVAALGGTSLWVMSGAAAIAQIATDRFDLIFMDLNMPGQDGYATARLIRRTERPGRRIPIIALTANDAFSHREACLLAGMDDILSKPYTLEQCAAMLDRWAPRPARPGPREKASAQEIRELTCIDQATVKELGLVGRSGGGGSLYCKLVTLYESNSPASLAQVGHALAARDFARAAEACHKLKGASANVGAVVFSSTLDRLEQACRAADVDIAQDLFESLEIAHPRLLEQLQQTTLKAIA